MGPGPKGVDMLEDNGIFRIDSAVSHNKLKKIHKEIEKKIKEIKTIQIDQSDSLGSSALVSLLKIVKSSYPDIVIPLIDEKETQLKGVGKFVIIDKNNSGN